MKTQAPRWTDEFLDSYIRVGDERADRMFAVLMAEGDLESIQTLMARVTRADVPPPEDLPAVLRDFLARESRLPTWADPEKIRIAQELFYRHGTQIVLTLFCIVLPEGYAIWKPTRILYMTNNLGRYVHRRVVETAQFLLDVMAPEGLSPRGRGIRSIQKVRLIHAAARAFVARNPRWDADWGTPINQEDMAATIGGFSYLSLQGLEKMGIRLKPGEQEAYLHCWAVVGHLIGVESALNLRTMREGDEFFVAYRRRNRGATPEGVELTRNLTDFMNSRLPGPLRELPESFILFFLGEEAGAMIGITPRGHALLRPFRGISRWIHRLQKKSSAFSRLSGRMTRAILERLLALEIQDAPVRFDLPMALRTSWNIESVYRRVRRLEWRLEGRVRVTVGNARWEARPINISPRGLRLRLLPPEDATFSQANLSHLEGRSARLLFRLTPEPEFEADARIVRLTPSSMGTEIGLSFAGLSGASKRGLENVLRGALRKIQEGPA